MGIWIAIAVEFIVGIVRFMFGNLEAWVLFRPFAKILLTS